MRRLILGILTILVLLFSVGPALLGSLKEPQIANQLELYQTELLLRAREIQVAEEPTLSGVDEVLGQSTSLETIAEQYEETRQSVQASVARLQEQLETLQTAALPAELDSESSSVTTVRSFPQVETKLHQQRQLNQKLGLRLGLLYALQDDTNRAIATWQDIVRVPSESTDSSDSVAATSDSAEQVTEQMTEEATELSQNAIAAETLIGLWSEPSRIVPNAEAQIQDTLDGWFENRALERLYELQQRSDALADLEAEEQQVARQTLVKLAILGTGPILGCLIGAVILIVLVAQRIFRGKEALLAERDDLAWTTPWPWDITWQVILVGFFFLGQLILPLTVSLIRSVLTQSMAEQGINLTLSSSRATAITTALIYLLMSVASIGVLYVSIKPFLPLPEGWFRLSLRGKWFLWGLGGYLVAVPLVIGVSLVNQQLWQGSGGSNPLLQIVLEEGDTLSLSIFFFTAAIAAPIFEEILFRGFLLPSLSRYMSVWGAIALSSLIFATAHLSFSEILPLMVLGMVLGFVYSRSRNLLSSIMVHSLWNSATMIGLLILGSSID